MNVRELEDAMRDEVENNWPGASIEFVSGGKHPKAKLRFGELVMAKPYPGTPSDSVRGLHKCLADVRRALRSMGAERSKPDPKPEEDEKRYSKPNEGREKRPDPVAREPVKPKPDLAEQLVENGHATQAVAGMIDPRFRDEDDPPAQSPKQRSLERERIREAAAQIRDGIYFGLDEDVYHAVERLSTSAIQKLLVSPATFWKSSWLNPKTAELDEETTKAQILGRAYHCARLEPDQLEKRFCKALSKADFAVEGTCWNGTEIGIQLARYGEAKKRAGESVIEQAMRLEECGYAHPIWPLEQHRWSQTLDGRVPIPAIYWDEMVDEIDRIRHHDEIAPLLEGGAAEVSVFWTDQHGIPMKCRFDYLAVSHWADFKTFDNSRGKELEQALVDAVRYNRYHVTAVVYRDGAEAVRVGNLPIIGDATDEQRKLVAQLQLRPGELECWFIFQEKNGIPNLLAREFPFFDVPLNNETWKAGASEEAIARAESAQRGPTRLMMRGRNDVEKAKRSFVQYSQIYPAGRPWQPINARRSWDDYDFNTYWLEQGI